MTQMEKSEQRFIIKFFFMKGLGAKATHKELTAVLGTTAYSLHEVKEWRARFAAGDLSCQTNSELIVHFTFLGRLCPTSVRSFLLQLLAFLRNTSLSLRQQSEISFEESLGYIDSLEGGSRILNLGLFENSRATFAKTDQNDQHFRRPDFPGYHMDIQVNGQQTQLPQEVFLWYHDEK
jgi:hypothetical protein